MTGPTPEDVAGYLVSEYETFARLPEWVLDAEISDRAVRLFAVLLRHADRGGSCFPSRGRLAQRLRCSTDSVDRAVKELVTLRALAVEHHGGQPGEPWRSNTYRLLRQPRDRSESEHPSRTGAATPGRTGAASLAARVRSEREPVEREPKTEVLLSDQGRTTPTEAEFQTWYDLYPRHDGKIKARKAYEKARRTVTAELLLAGARRYREDPNREAEFTKQPATWLNQGCWDDEPLPPRAMTRVDRGNRALQEQMATARALDARVETPMFGASRVIGAIPAGQQ